MPLMELSMLKKWWRLWSNEPTTQRTSVGLEDMDTPFVPYLPPWGLLDDEGEEVADQVSTIRLIPFT